MQVPCNNCGVLILGATAQRNGGWCAPCRKDPGAAALRRQMKGKVGVPLETRAVFGGGDGSSAMSAIKIGGVVSASEAVKAQYLFISSRFPDAILGPQSARKVGAHSFDVHQIGATTGTREIWFLMSAFLTVPGPISAAPVPTGKVEATNKQPGLWARLFGAKSA